MKRDITMGSEKVLPLRFNIPLQGRLLQHNDDFHRRKPMHCRGRDGKMEQGHKRRNSKRSV